MERFASVIRLVKSSDTAYWLVVAASVAYMASATLFVWAPLKYFILKTQRFSEVTNWWVLPAASPFLYEASWSMNSYYSTLTF